MQSQKLVLHNISYDDLSSHSGLNKLDSQFIEFLRENDPEAAKNLKQYRRVNSLSKTAESDFLIEIAKHLEDFIARLFNINKDIKALREQSLALDPIIAFKKLIVLKECKKYHRNIADFPTFEKLHSWLIEELSKHSYDYKKDMELAVSKLAVSYFINREKSADEIANIAMWACYCMHADHVSIVQNWISFKVPQKIVPDDLIKTITENNTKYIPAENIKARDGFSLTDHGMSSREIKSELNHCIYCHDKEGDFCSTGFFQKKSQPELGYKTNAHGNELLGCPLEQKISEMNVLKQEGLAIAPLAMLMLDNPMCPLTGHRICNDCMQACVYQKQDPVDIPQIESRILKDILHLPWGAEIYDLLTKWNPLSQQEWLMQPYNGYKVMVMGMGPAGIAMSHYLLRQGCAVVGADGAKIPMIDKDTTQKPVYDFSSFADDLTKCDFGGFGGVAEYGITARWDKKLLKLAYLSLARKKYFNLMGSTRFGGSITIRDVWEMGFDHLAVSVGAGLPKALNIPGSLAPGVMSANSFLMSLHLNGGNSSSSITDLEVKLPAIVIGGGLTGVDTATEVQAYYIKQVESIYDTYHALAKTHDLDSILKQVGGDLSLFVQHGKEVKELRKKALQEGKTPNFSALIQKFGGVKIVYRKRMQDSPAYRNNYYELDQALQEGVVYMENLSPEQFLLDENGRASGLQVRDVVSGSITKIPAKAILFATGSKPNVAYGFEHASDLERKGFGYLLYREEGGSLHAEDMAEKHCKSSNLAFFSSYREDGKRVSVIGDTNPAFHGSVVKALASAKSAAPAIMASMRHNFPKKDIARYEDFAAKILINASSKIVAIEEEGTVKKVTIWSPLAVKKHCVGSFFRIQNYKHDSKYLHPIAAFPCDVDKEQGTFSFYLLDSYEHKLISCSWQQGSIISVMGPTGVRTSLPKTPTTVLMMLDYSQIGPGAYIASALKKHGNRVQVVLELEKGQGLYAKEQLIAACDKLLIVTGGGFLNENLLDKVDIFEGDMSEALIKEYSFGTIDLHSSGMVVIKGMATFVAKLKKLRFDDLKDRFTHNPKTTALVLGPMNCMLKGICAQCLQWQVDPITGQRTKEVYACSWQDQPLEIVAVDHLLERDKTADNVVTRLNKMLQLSNARGIL